MTNIPHKPIREPDGSYEVGKTFETELEAAQPQPLNDGALRERLRDIMFKAAGGISNMGDEEIDQVLAAVAAHSPSTVNLTDKEMFDMFTTACQRVVWGLDEKHTLNMDDFESLCRGQWGTLRGTFDMYNPSTEAAVLDARISQIDFLLTDLVTYRNLKNQLDVTLLSIRDELKAQRAALESVTTDEGGV